MVKLVSFITLFNVYFSELSGGGSKSTGMKLIPYDLLYSSPWRSPKAKLVWNKLLSCGLVSTTTGFHVSWKCHNVYFHVCVCLKKSDVLFTFPRPRRLTLAALTFHSPVWQWPKEGPQGFKAWAEHPSCTCKCVALCRVNGRGRACWFCTLLASLFSSRKRKVAGSKNV